MPTKVQANNINVQSRPGLRITRVEHICHSNSKTFKTLMLASISCHKD